MAGKFSKKEKLGGVGTCMKGSGESLMNVRVHVMDMCGVMMMHEQKMKKTKMLFHSKKKWLSLSVSSAVHMHCSNRDIMMIS